MSRPTYSAPSISHLPREPLYFTIPVDKLILHSYAEEKFGRDGIDIKTMHHVEWVEKVSIDQEKRGLELTQFRISCSSKNKEKVCYLLRTYSRLTRVL